MIFAFIFRLHRDGLVNRLEEHRLPRLETTYPYQFVSEWRRERDAINKSGSAKWRAVNVSQPLNNLDLIPDNIPIIIGTNKHEGEIFVHSAFPIAMAKVWVSSHEHHYVFFALKYTTPLTTYIYTLCLLSLCTGCLLAPCLEIALGKYCSITGALLM
jgi:hypothetical protein